MKKKLITAGAVAFWLIVWEVAARLVDKSVLLASPIEVAARLVELIPEEAFLKSVFFTAGRVLLGFFLGTAVGIAFAALAGKFAAVERLLAPLLACIKSIPVASFTILALIWISSKNLSVLIAFLIAVPVVYSNLLEGIGALDPELREMAAIFKIPPLRRLVGIYLSQLLPYFRSAARLAIGLCWKSGVAAEVIGVPRGSIGERLYSSKIYLETADLFAWTIVVILVSLFCEKLFLLLIDLLSKRIEKM
ncbi:MAG: ABC transporter permease subunit [Bacteroides sp.]|nr:ABC transporter permease subunit [Eubacterium sp.]MCM1417362.1 ABC transporter permease subunit [Roseburia sp.]MCM1461446.1 ABC transporter permease subunit [Bacteroides sp.]